MTETSNHPTVLIVENEPLLREAAVESLRSAGYRVLEAANGEVAIAFLGTGNAIDLLFTDIRLGGTQDGWDVAEAFREKHPAIPVIYCSGYMTKPPRVVDGGIFLTKPCSSHQIIAAARQLITRSSMALP
jgi:CheY-like chemotaxis protein